MMLDQQDIDVVYICGLEIEVENGRYIIDYLKHHPELKIYFARGPRAPYIEEERLSILFDLHCILRTHSDIITLGDKDAIVMRRKQDF